jgi:hypothetical protein
VAPSLRRPAPGRRLGESSRATGLVVAGVILLTAVAFVLRLVGIDQTLYADEDFTYYIVARHGLGGVWDAVYNTSITPPLHYGLAWLSLKLGGDNTVLVRLPSLLFGTALVPLVYAWARRVSDSAAGLLAALLVALSPFAIWYSDEARAYATMMFLVALSSFALLKAVRGDGRAWWVVHVLCACAALWAHYTAVFVIVAQAAWALWAYREHLRTVLIAEGIVALGYLPWLPGFIEQRQNKTGVGIIGELGPLNASTVFELPVRTLIGHPYFGLREFPGTKGLVIVLVLGALALAALAIAGRTPSRAGLGTFARSDLGLLVLLTVATPAGLVLYAALGSSLWLPRNLAASVPAFTVLAGVVIMALARLVPRPLAAVALAGVAVVAGLNAFKAVDDESFRRPPFREAAEYVDEEAAPGDPVVEATLALLPDERLPPITLDRYFDEPKPRLYRAGSGDGPAWRRARSGRDMYLIFPVSLRGSVLTQNGLAPGERAPAGLLRRIDSIGGPDGRAVVRERRSLPRLVPVDVVRNRGALDGRLEDRGGKETIVWTRGRVAVTAGSAQGEVDRVSAAGSPLQLSGWALSRDAKPVDWTLLFSGDRLVAVTAGGARRPDVAAEHGPGAVLSGFGFAHVPKRADAQSLRVFAVSGDRAAELPFSGAIKRALEDRG